MVLGESPRGQEIANCALDLDAELDERHEREFAGKLLDGRQILLELGRKNLRQSVLATSDGNPAGVAPKKLIARGRDDPADIDAVYKEVLADDEDRRDPNDAAIIGLLRLVRDNHLKNEGCIFDMYRLWQDFSATDSGTVDLSRVKLHSHSVYHRFAIST